MEALKTQWAEVALGLLDRVEIKGHEARVLIQVQQHLAEIAQGNLLVFKREPAPPGEPE